MVVLVVLAVLAVLAVLVLPVVNGRWYLAANRRRRDVLGLA